MRHFLKKLPFIRAFFARTNETDEKPVTQPPQNWHARVWRIAAPIMLSNLTLPIVGAVDTAMAGHLPGPEYLAGVSVATLIFGFAFWTFSFIRLSTTGYIAQAFGSGDMPELCNVAVRAAIVAVGIALLLLLVQFPIKFFSLFLIDAGDAVSHQAELYFDIRVWAAPAVMGNFVVTGILIGLQRAGLALVVQSIIAVVNVVLDLLFVLEFGWQVPGIAAATVAAEYSGLLIGAAIIARTSMIRSGLTPNALRFTAFKRLLSFNRDLMIRTLSLTFAFGVFISLSARIGETTLAANEVLMMFLSFSAFALDGFANACEAMVGEAYGRRDRTMLRSVVRTSTIWAFISAIAICLTFQITGEMIVNLLTDISEVRVVAYEYLVFVVLMPIVGVWSFVIDGVFIGAARGRDIRNAMIVSVGVYLPVIFLLDRELGNTGLWFGLMFLFLARAITLGSRIPRLARDIAGGEERLTKGDLV